MATARRGFTIVELIVTVGVVLLLIALAFPAMSGYRTKMRDLQCMENLKGISHALHVYATENNGWLPSCVQINPETSEQSSDLRVVLSKYDPSLGSIVCPLDPRSKRDPNPKSAGYISYCYRFVDGIDLGKLQGVEVVVYDLILAHKHGKQWLGSKLYSDERITLE